MTWNDPDFTPSTRVASASVRGQRKLVWGASMIWEDAGDCAKSETPAKSKRAPRRANRPTGARLVHALLGAFIGLGR
ncbi:MAG: hypothetical protein ACO1SX_29490 [Actinomycetota bacterium]